VIEMPISLTDYFVFFFFFLKNSPVSDLSCKRLDCWERISSNFDLASRNRAFDLDAISCWKIISKLN